MINLTRMQIMIGVERRLRFKREKILSKATKVTTVLTGMPRGSGGHNQVEDGAIELYEMDTETAYREMLDRLSNMRVELEEILPSLDDPDDMGIMRLRYIYGHSPEEIPDMVHLSRRAMFYHLSKAERTLCSMYPDKVCT